jgi:MFS family permease
MVCPTRENSGSAKVACFGREWDLIRQSPWSPLAFAAFRWLWIASVVSNIGTWMQNVGAAWMMTSLPQSSPLLVALVQTATTLPVFMLGFPAGAIADIVDRRKLLLITQGWMLAAAGALGALTMLKVAGPYTLLWLTFALGLGSAMNGPAWLAIMPELVPKRELPAAITLNSVGFNLARAVGPAVGGLVVAAIGAGAAFILNAVSFVAVLIVLYWWKREPEHETVGGEGVGPAIWAGIRYVRFAPFMHSVLLRSGLFVISGSAIWALLPVVAKVEFHSESTGYGVLLGFLGLGSIAGAFILTRLRQIVSPEMVATGGVVLFGLATLGLAGAAKFGLLCALMLAGGIGWMSVNSTLNTSAQTSLPGWVRARALAVYLLVFQGAMAIGSVIWGEIASRYGLRLSLFVAGLALLAAAIVTFPMRLGTPGLDTTPSQHWPEPKIIVEPDPEHGPVLITMEYQVDPARGADFARAMKDLERIRRRDGAIQWGLFEDAGAPGRFVEQFLVESWGEHLRQHARVTVADRVVEERAYAFHNGTEPPKVTHWLAARD